MKHFFNSPQIVKVKKLFSETNLLNKSLFGSLLFTLLSTSGSAGNGTTIQTGVATKEAPMEVSLISSDVNTNVINCAVSSFVLEDVENATKKITTLELENGIPLYEKGAPDLKRISTSLIIPNRGNMEVKVLSSTYKDYENIDLAPSKGVLMISDDASKIPYEYGEVYQKDAFFPGNLAELREAHIMRNVRGQVVDIYPFQYNPVKKILRVYTSLQLQVNVNASIAGANCLEEKEVEVPQLFHQMYENNYLNYAAAQSKFRSLNADANGRMLVIYYDNFKTSIDPFIEWKTRKGIETEAVAVSTIGNAAAIKTYISNYYKAHSDLAYVVFVGDYAQVPASIVGSEKYTSDNEYSRLDGTDNYPEIICGRISAETAADVDVQVKKFLTYEKTPNSMDVDHFNTGAVLSLKIGPDNSTKVYLDMQAAKKTLEGAGYNAITELYTDGASTKGPTVANINAAVNTGLGYLSWISHGSPTSLISFSYTTTHVKQLTNTGMWPMIWNCSCQTGNFKSGNACFAETWLRANQSGRPVGAIGVAMSTRDMPMGPSEKYGNAAAKLVVDNTRKNKTYGGVTFDTYVKVAIGDYKMPIEFNCMILFGDPSLELRTKAPLALTATHKQSDKIGISNLVVDCNVEGAYIALTVNNKIIGTGYVTGGKVDIKFKDPITTDAVINVTGTSFNYSPYFGQVIIGNITNIETINNVSSFNVYPNPTENSLNVSFEIQQKSNYTLEVKNVLGQTVYAENLPADFAGQYNKQINLSEYGKGVYTLSLSGTHDRINKKIIVQ
jgi:hypothetical protein